jgi:hypothetical protein
MGMKNKIVNPGVKIDFVYRNFGNGGTTVSADEVKAVRGKI